jgi:hypothetical protein
VAHPTMTNTLTHLVTAPTARCRPELGVDSNIPRRWPSVAQEAGLESHGHAEPTGHRLGLEPVAGPEVDPSVVSPR